MAGRSVGEEHMVWLLLGAAKGTGEASVLTELTLTPAVVCPLADADAAGETGRAAEI
jgi:hypothetical protein